MKFSFLLLAAILLTISTDSFPASSDVPAIVEKYFTSAPKEIEQITSGLTNENYKVTLQDGQRFIVRIGRSNPAELGIDRMREAACLKALSSTGVIPKSLFIEPSQGLLISELIDARELTADELRSPKRISEVAKLLKTCHQVPYRPDLDKPSFLDCLRQLIAKGKQIGFVDAELEGELESRLSRLQLFIPKTTLNGLCHTDLFAPNFIQSKDTLYLIDWEYGGWDCVLVDLASFSVEQNLNPTQKAFLLNAYFDTSAAITTLALDAYCHFYELRNALWYAIQGDKLQNSVFTKKAYEFLAKFLASQLTESGSDL